MGSKIPLKVEKTGKVWRIAWGDMGARLCYYQGDEEEEFDNLRRAVKSMHEFPEDEDWRNYCEECAANWAARETGANDNDEGAYWPTRAKAVKALSYIKKRMVALMDGAEPEPWWMGKARAAGWTPPKE